MWAVRAKKHSSVHAVLHLCFSFFLCLGRRCLENNIHEAKLHLRWRPCSRSLKYWRTIRLRDKCAPRPWQDDGSVCLLISTSRCYYLVGEAFGVCYSDRNILIHFCIRRQVQYFLGRKNHQRFVFDNCSGVWSDASSSHGLITKYK